VAKAPGTRGNRNPTTTSRGGPYTPLGGIVGVFDMRSCLELRVDLPEAAVRKGIRYEIAGGTRDVRIAIMTALSHGRPHRMWPDRVRSEAAAYKWIMTVLTRRTLMAPLCVKTSSGAVF